MTNVVSVRFKKAGRSYYFDPGDLTINMGDCVVVETAQGVEVGEVVFPIREILDEQVVSPLKRVLRIANEEDLARLASNVTKQEEAFIICEEKIIAHQLEMKLVEVEASFDGSKIIFFFTANGRVDFRELVKDLASVFRTRIELRQIGVRDEAKMLGGLGPCGRQNCCGAFLEDFQPVSIKMAKEQNLSLNPTKISGLCGRLMCCLKYEQNHYEETRKRMPRVGKDVITPDGRGVVLDVNVLKEKLRVRVSTNERNYEIKDYDEEQVRKPEPRDEKAPASEKVVDEMKTPDQPNDQTPKETPQAPRVPFKKPETRPPMRAPKPTPPPASRRSPVRRTPPPRG